MSNIKSAKLTKTIKYRSQSDKQFKYEIYQSSDGLTAFAMVSWLIELIDGSDVWVWSVLDEEVILLTGGKHPTMRIRKHENILIAISPMNRELSRII